MLSLCTQFFLSTIGCFINYILVSANLLLFCMFERPGQAPSLLCCLCSLSGSLQFQSNPIDRNQTCVHIIYYTYIQHYSTFAHTFHCPHRPPLPSASHNTHHSERTFSRSRRACTLCMYLVAVVRGWFVQKRLHSWPLTILHNSECELSAAPR